ncbi:AIPR family protein [Mannheimia haemolytica]|nr:AIPR family protein [Mannheimia haemolytica]STY62130.1 AIPR protein [Mannheimia haemolytica]
MSNNTMKNEIVENNLAKFASSFGYEKKKQDEQFELFCNYIALDGHILNEELDVSTTGGGADLGLDGLVIIANNKIITDLVEVDELNKSIDIDVRLYFIQAKRGKLELDELRTFYSGVVDFLNLGQYQEEGKDLEKIANENIRDKYNILEALRNTKKIKSSIKYYLYYFYAGYSDKTESVDIEKDKVIKEIIELNIGSPTASNIFVKICNGDELIKMYKSIFNTIEKTIKPEDKIILTGNIGNIINKSMLMSVSFNEFLKLIRDENDLLIYSVFEDNVRDFQSKSELNKSIKDSLNKDTNEGDKGDIDNKKFFGILNNGITIIADKVTEDGKNITLKNYQIVNGCQTSNILFESRNVKGIEDVFVTIKLLETDNEILKNTVIRSTNSQTEIKAEQLISLSDYSRKLEDYYLALAKSNSIPLYYERRSNQYRLNPDIKQINIITMASQIKGFTACILGKPEELSGSYKKMLEEFKKSLEKNNKESVYYLSALIYYRMQSYFRNNSIDSKNRKVQYYIMLAVSLLLIGKAEISKLNSNKIDVVCKKSIKYLCDDIKSLDLFKKALNIIENQIFDETKDRYRDKNDTTTLFSYFKSQNIKPMFISD